MFTDVDLKNNSYCLVQLYSIIICHALTGTMFEVLSVSTKYFNIIGQRQDKAVLL